MKEKKGAKFNLASSAIKHGLPIVSVSYQPISAKLPDFKPKSDSSEVGKHGGRRS